MSKTPVLSAGQQRQSLSAQKKKPPRASLKNVLAQPYDRHWPEISAAEAVQLVEAIGAIRLGAAEKTAWKSDHCTRGLSETLRHLQSESDSSIEILLLSADIRPKFIVEQVLVLAAGRSSTTTTRCLLLPGLRDLLSPPQSLGLPACMCVSFSGVRSLPAFRPVVELVDRLSDQHTTPPSWQPPRVRKQRPQKREAPKPARKAAHPPINFDELYVPRPTTNPSATAPQLRRTFVPAGTVFRSQKASADWSDYISLGSDASAADAVKRKPAAKIDLSAIEKMKRKMQVPGAAKVAGAGGRGGGYVTLSVNRVQGNPSKVRNSGGPKNGAVQKRK